MFLCQHIHFKRFFVWYPVLDILHKNKWIENILVIICYRRVIQPNVDYTFHVDILDSDYKSFEVYLQSYIDGLSQDWRHDT